jgi:nitrogen-specific signal transduction histidine kinase
VLLGDGGTPIRAIGISMDVTAQRSLEAQYLQSQKMEVVGQLAGGVAHDFNNLLTAILGYCELLLADMSPDDPRSADVREIHVAGTRAAGLTRQLLTFSRKQIIEPTLVDLGDIVAGMRTMLERLIGEPVRIVVHRETPRTPIKADRGQVEQVLMNLALNARDAMPDGGVLSVETSIVALDASTRPDVAPGPYATLTVTDTGSGMTREVQERLFEPFFTTKPVGKGTGLGLATVQSIVERSDGFVDVHSEVGRGTAIKIGFPLASATDASLPPAASTPKPRFGTQTVLVVEDADGLRELTTKLLKRLGYSVLVAASADQALRLFETHPDIDVVLTDVVMPGASGVELTKWLVERRPGLKVIYMSGYTEDAIVHHGVLNDGIAFLHKPFTSATLAQKLRDVLDS